MLLLYYIISGDKMEKEHMNLLVTASLAGLVGAYLFERQRGPVDWLRLTMRGTALGSGAVISTLLYEKYSRQQSLQIGPPVEPAPALLPPTRAEALDIQEERAADQDEALRRKISETLGHLHALEMQCMEIGLDHATRDAACQQIPVVLRQLEDLESLLAPAMVIAGAEIDNFAMESVAAAGS